MLGLRKESVKGRSIQPRRILSQFSSILIPFVVILRLPPVFCGKFPTNLFEGLSGETSEGIVFYGIANLDGVAADFTVFDVGVMANREV